MIPEKSFSRLLELEAKVKDAQNDRRRLSASIAACEAFMDEISWPWKASNEQIAYWNVVQSD